MFEEDEPMEEWAMTNLISNDPREIVAEHLETLRAYATKVLVNDEQLTEEELADKADDLRSFKRCALPSTLLRKRLSPLS